MDLIEEIAKFGVNWGQHCNRLESKDCVVKCAEMQGSNQSLSRGLLTTISKLQGPKRKWPLTIERRRFKENCSSSSSLDRTKTDASPLLLQ
jgi:hypothetical protein